MIQRYNPAPDQGPNATKFTRFVTNANGSCVLWKDHEADRERLVSALKACDKAFGRINLGTLERGVAWEVWEAQSKARELISGRTDAALAKENHHE